MPDEPERRVSKPGNVREDLGNVILVVVLEPGAEGDDSDPHGGDPNIRRKGPCTRLIFNGEVTFKHVEGEEGRGLVRLHTG